MLLSARFLLVVLLIHVAIECIEAGKPSKKQKTEKHHKRSKKGKSVAALPEDPPPEPAVEEPQAAPAVEEQPAPVEEHAPEPAPVTEAPAPPPESSDSGSSGSGDSSSSNSGSADSASTDSGSSNSGSTDSGSSNSGSSDSGSSNSGSSDSSSSNSGSGDSGSSGSGSGDSASSNSGSGDSGSSNSGSGDSGSSDSGSSDSSSSSSKSKDSKPSSGSSGSGSSSHGDGDIHAGSVNQEELEEKEDETPDPDPFQNNLKWSLMRQRVDSLFNELKSQTVKLGGLLVSEPKENLVQFAKNFSTFVKPLNDFFAPIHEQLVDGAAHSVINPAIGLTDLKKLNEWTKDQGGLKRLQKSKIQWIEVNSLVVTVHHVFDRLYPQIEKWGLEDAEDVEKNAYPGWVRSVSSYDGGDKANYELKHLNELLATIDSGIEEQGKENHMFRDLEKILRKYLSSWDPDSDYNIYCYGNNEFGIIHDIWDLLTDAAIYFSASDLKAAVVQSLVVVYHDYMNATGGGEEGHPTDKSAASDVTSEIEKIFDTAKERIKKKIEIGDLVTGDHEIYPGPTTFKCDRAPGDNTSVPGEPGPNEQQPSGHGPPDDYKPPRIPPGGQNHTYPVSEWGILPDQSPAQPLSPKAVSPTSILDPQSGPAHALPTGYIDKRQGAFQFAAFSQAYMGYLEAEMVLNPDGSCKSTCADFKRPVPTCENKTIDCDAYRNSFCEPGTKCMEKSKCTTTARKCIRTNYNVEFCPSQAKDRLYDWVDINGTLVGKIIEDDNRNCEAGVVKIKERWEMDFGLILNAPQYCEVCLCVCDSPMSEEGYHYVDLNPITASSGNVITSIRFAQSDNILRLEAEEAKVDENGKIDPESAKWMDPPSSGDKSDKSRYALLAGPEGFRKLGLDMVYGKKNEVITGIKFIQKGDTIHLSAQATPVDEKTGALSGSSSEWFEANYPEPDPIRRQINLDDKKSSNAQLGPSQPYNLPDNRRYIRFDATSLPQDAGQNVIPFFDLQPVRHHTQRKPLNAVGFLYKAKRGYGGFISPVVTTWKKLWLA